MGKTNVTRYIRRKTLVNNSVEKSESYPLHFFFDVDKEVFNRLYTCYSQVPVNILSSCSVRMSNIFISKLWFLQTKILKR